MPIEAEFFALGTRLVVSFDKPIVNQPLSAANWFITHTRGDNTVPDSAEVIGPQEVRLQFVAAQSDYVNVQYLASPADVVGAPPNDLPVEAFTFPIS